MTVARVDVIPWRGYLNQAIMVMLMNVPTVSFGLAMGWVSLASGEGAEGSEASEFSDGSDGSEGGTGRVVVAATTTFLSALLAVPLAARALRVGRKFTVIATSLVFAACWALKLCGGWAVVAGRVLAGGGGTAAWALAPVLAREMCSSRARGAAVAALVLAHNIGFMLMYLAADRGLEHSTVLWCCFALSIGHCVVYSFTPESPSFLAAKGDLKGARVSLSWLRGARVDAASIDAEMKTLPAVEDPSESSFKVFKDLVSSPQRRRALVVSTIAVVGQESCGVFALLQFAERVFVLARDETAARDATHALGATAATNVSSATYAPGVLMSHTSHLASPARHAVVLGAVQLVASCFALYFVERIGRRPLIISTGLATACCLCVGAVALWLCTGPRAELWTTAALAGAVAFDSAGLQPAPYAMLADMFHYEFRGCAVMVATAGACLGNALEVVVFAATAQTGGLRAALLLSAALTLVYTVFVVCLAPETRGRTPEQIYEVLGPPIASPSVPASGDVTVQIKNNSNDTNKSTTTEKPEPENANTSF